MLNRSNLFLAALLLAQIVLIAISTLVTGGREERAVQPILAEMAVADIERVTIADDLDNAMIFARHAEGWVLPKADDFPLDSEKVDEILDKLGPPGYAAAGGVESGQLRSPGGQGRRVPPPNRTGGRWLGDGTVSGRQRRRGHGLRAARRR